MKGKMNLANIFLVAKREYMKWLVNPKMILLAVVFLPMRDAVIIPLLQASAKMQSPINMLEPCISILNNWMGLLLLSLVYIILMSPFPTLDGNMFFYVFRMGRKNWILGEMLFQLMSVVTYSFFTLLITVVQVFNASFFANGWSLIVTNYDKLYGSTGGFKIAEVIPPNLFFQISPFKACLFSFGLFSLFLLLCGMLFIVGCLYQKRILFFSIQVLHIAVGCGLILLRSKAMWLFPISHSILACHYRKYFRKYIFPPGLSLVIFCLVLFALMIIMYKRAKKISLDMIGGDVLL